MAIAAIKRKLETSVPKLRVVDLFKRWDKDKSGAMSKAELKLALSSIGYEGDIEKAWPLLDADGTGKVELNELQRHVAAAGIKRRPASAPKDRPAADDTSPTSTWRRQYQSVTKPVFIPTQPAPLVAVCSRIYFAADGSPKVSLEPVLPDSPAATSPPNTPKSRFAAWQKQSSSNRAFSPSASAKPVPLIRPSASDASNQNPFGAPRVRPSPSDRAVVPEPPKRTRSFPLAFRESMARMETPQSNAKKPGARPCEARRVASLVITQGRGGHPAEGVGSRR